MYKYPKAPLFLKQKLFFTFCLARRTVPNLTDGFTLPLSISSWLSLPANISTMLSRGLRSLSFLVWSMPCLALGWLLVPPPVLEEMKTHSWVLYKPLLLPLAVEGKSGNYALEKKTPASLLEAWKTITHLNEIHMKVNHVVKSIIPRSNDRKAVTFKLKELSQCSIQCFPNGKIHSLVCTVLC